MWWMPRYNVKNECHRAFSGDKKTSTNTIRICYFLQCFFANATNNVIWRLVTGRRTRQDDPELTRLTRTIADIFKNSDPSNPFTMLQVFSKPEL